MAARRRQGTRSALQVVCIIALSLLLIGILFSEISRTAMALRRDTAAVTTLKERLSAVGYVFRDERTVSSVDSGAISFSVASGSTVAAGAELALVYADGSNTGTRARAAEITAEIERLQALDDPGVIPDYYGAYEALMSSLSTGAVLNTQHAREVVRDALDRHAAAREEASVRAERIAALQAEFEALIENDRNACDRVVAPAGGVFYREVDGYEAVLTTEAVETLTPGGLRALLASPQTTAQAVGKIAKGGTWYLAVPIASDRAAAFQAERAYEIATKRTDERMVLTLSRITDADTSGEVLLIFRAENVPLPSDLARCEEIEIVTAAKSGIWVPMVALREENGTYTVFVDVDGVAAKRKVEPLLIENGYCLATVNASAEYLQQGERIVVTPRHIYEGKALK